MRHVIVGAGPAGVIAAEHLRKFDPDGEIKLIGAEPEPPYSRMAIPYLLSGQIDETGTYLRKQQDHYERLGISLVQGQVITTGIVIGNHTPGFQGHTGLATNLEGPFNDVVGLIHGLFDFAVVDFNTPGDITFQFRVHQPGKLRRSLGL